MTKNSVSPTSILLQIYGLFIPNRYKKTFNFWFLKLKFKVAQMY